MKINQHKSIFWKTSCRLVHRLRLAMIVYLLKGCPVKYLNNPVNLTPRGDLKCVFLQFDQTQNMLKGYSLFGVWEVTDSKQHWLSSYCRWNKRKRLLSSVAFPQSVEEKIILMASADWCQMWKHISFSRCGCILPAGVVISQWSGHLMCSWWLPFSCL